MTTPSTVRINSPTAMVSYSHGNPGWTDEQEKERQQQVHRLVVALRTFGVDADADIFHPNEDWTRWGPRQVADSDFVLIVASRAWQLAWIGEGDPIKHKGARAEASAVRSIENLGGTIFQQRCRLIMLPGISDADIPLGMHGLTRHHVMGFEFSDLEPLIRDLTNQPSYLQPPVGPVPILPPAMTTHTPEVAHAPAPSAGRGIEQSTATPRSRTQQERIEQLRSQLAALPTPLPGEDPNLPWYRLRQTIEGLLATELQSTTRDATTAGAAPDVRWLPATNIPVDWVDQWQPGITYHEAAVILHLLPLPPAPVSQRLLVQLHDAATRIIRSRDLVDVSAGLRSSAKGTDVMVEAEAAQRRYDEVSMGAFLGLRVQRSGQVSVWYSLPTDRMGSVLDLHHLERDLEVALGVGAALIDSGIGDTLGQVAIAAELVNTILLTDGHIDQLGNRNQASTPGMTGRTARMEPDESVDLRHLRTPNSKALASAVATVLIRAWTS